MQLPALTADLECADQWQARLRDLHLTHRELEVLVWVCRGKTNAEIGQILGAKRDTVRTHVAHILKKLCVENRTAAAATVFEVLSSRVL